MISNIQGRYLEHIWKKIGHVGTQLSLSNLPISSSQSGAPAFELRVGLQRHQSYRSHPGPWPYRAQGGQLVYGQIFRELPRFLGLGEIGVFFWSISVGEFQRFSLDFKLF